MNLLARGLLAIALAGCGTLAIAAPAKSVAVAAATKPLPSESVYQLPVPLTDQHGRTADWRTRRGRPQLVSMFYTSCPFICPLIIDSGLAVQHNLSAAERGRLDVLLVSMDPKRDTPAALMSVATKRRLDPARWTLASPKPGDVRSVAGVLGVRYRELEDGEFNHTSALVLLDADGRVVARTEKIGTVPDPEFMAAVHKLLAPAPKR